MKILIATTVTQAPGTPVGQLSGAIDLPALPRAGEIISFLFPVAGLMPAFVKAFSGHLRVVEVVHSPSDQGGEVQLALEPLALGSADEVQAVTSDLESAFGLLWEPFEDASPASGSEVAP